MKSGHSSSLRIEKLSILLWSWAICWVLGWSVGKSKSKVLRNVWRWLCVWVYDRQLGQRAIWLPLPWRQDSLQGSQHLLWSITVDNSGDFYGTTLKQYEQEPVCIVRWWLQLTHCCEAWIHTLEGATADSALWLSWPLHCPAPIPFILVFPVPEIACADFSFPLFPFLPTVVPFAILPVCVLLLLWL